METQEIEQYGINANETNNSSSGNEEMLKQREIEGTPFKKVTFGTQGKIVLGQYAITETMDLWEVEEKAEELKQHDWKIMVAVIAAITNQTVLTFKGEI